MEELELVVLELEAMAREAIELEELELFTLELEVREAMDAEMASWKSTGTYPDAVPPSRAYQRQGVDYFHTFSPTPKMTTLRVLLHVAAQRDYELHSLDFSTAFLQGSLHEEIWLRRPPGFIGSFPVGTQWSLRRPVYGLCHAPQEWHDPMRTTLAALGFTPSTANPSLFLRTDTLLPPFYVLAYVDDLVFATADTEALTLVKSELQKRHTCTDLGELRSYLGLQITRDGARRTITLTQSHMVHQVLQRFGFQFSSPQPTPLSTGHSLSAPPLDEFVEPSGLYPELVGFLMYLMTCTRPDLPLSLLACYVAPGRHRMVHCDAAKRVLRYLCSTSGMGLVLGGRGPVVLTGHADASWLCWLTYLLTDLGEQPRSPPVLYVDNKAMISLCQEHRLEHRTKHIALRYFLARELQQRGQLRLAFDSEYSSQWQTSMDAEMASRKSTGTYVDEVPPPRANIVDGMWIFRVKRPPSSPPAFKARYFARGFSQRQGVHFFQTFSPTPKMTTLWVLLHVAAQRDYELYSLDFSTAFLQGSLHEEIWLCRPPGFTVSFPAGTKWSLWWPVYILHQPPREWDDTLRTTLAALGFSPSSAYPSLFLRTDTTLPQFYVLVYVDDLVFATADTEALALVKAELQRDTPALTWVLRRFEFQYSSPQPTPLSTGHSLSAPPSDECSSYSH
ncbi:unnamed protein product [Closterium sp. NIES-54]